MSEELGTLTAQLVEKDLINVNFTEKEIISVEFTTVGLVPDRRHLVNLMDVDVENLEDLQILVYNHTTEKWENEHLSDIITQFQVIGETPTKLSATNFQTANNYISNSIQVMINGIIEKYITKIPNNKFSFPYSTVTDDIITVNYIKKV